jgi:hypothetical protein
MVVMRLKFVILACLLTALGPVLSACQPNPIELAEPARTAPQKPPATPPAQAADVEPGPKAAPRPGVQASSLPLPKISAGKRAPALSSLPVAPPVAPIAEPPEAASLDLKTLTAKLAKTEALGALTKIAVRNQLDDLVAGLRAYHAGERTASLAALRERYTQFMARVSGLLKDHDPALFVELREGSSNLWDRLSDPQKFAAL